MVSIQIEINTSKCCLNVVCVYVFDYEQLKLFVIDMFCLFLCSIQHE